MPSGESAFIFVSTNFFPLVAFSKTFVVLIDRVPTQKPLHFATILSMENKEGTKKTNRELGGKKTQTHLFDKIDPSVISSCV